MIHWLTTNPSGGAHTVECDEGRTGWKLHAVEASEDATLHDVRHTRSACGARAEHGWGLDLFIVNKCKRCLRALEKKGVVG